MTPKESINGISVVFPTSVHLLLKFCFKEGEVAMKLL
jgi:hypothetical protein